MLLYAVLCLATASGFEDPPPPEWPPVYTVRTDFYEPAIELNMPITVWHDGVQKKDLLYYKALGGHFYVGANMTDLNNSTLIMVHVTTSEEHLNMLNCSILYDDYKGLLSMRPLKLMPDLVKEQYVYIGKERIHGEDGLKYQKLKDSGDYMTEYVMWVALKKDVYVPLKYEQKHHIPPHQRLSYHIYVDYFDFNTSAIDPETWDIGKGLDCIQDLGADSVLSDNTSEFLLPLQDRKEHDLIRNDFAQFKIQFNKVYQGEDEHTKRLKIFEDNMRFINEHNKAGHSFKLTVNHLADRTEAELAMMRGRLPPSGPSKALPFPHTAEEVERLSQDLPTEFDWRPYGAVTPVKNQVSCGSCWAFSAVGAVEGAFFLRNGRDQLVRLSEQAVLDCSWGFDNYGCHGGYSQNAFEWMKIHGLPAYDAYGGYLNHCGFCHIDNVTSVATVKNYYNVTAGSEKALQVAIFKYGPVSVAINAGSQEFSFYSHGVYYEENCNPDSLDHEVLAVGYGVLDGEKYWLIKNSWGADWGVNGYILISTKNNNCGVESDAVYVELE